MSNNSTKVSESHFRSLISAPPSESERALKIAAAKLVEQYYDNYGTVNLTFCDFAILELCRAIGYPGSHSTPKIATLLLEASDSFARANRTDIPNQKEVHYSNYRLTIAADYVNKYFELTTDYRPLNVWELVVANVVYGLQFGYMQNDLHFASLYLSDAANIIINNVENSTP